MIDIQKQVVLAKYTTLGVGGLADELAIVRSREELLEALEYIRVGKLDFVVIGGGSNLLISDNGFQGFVIVNHTNGFSIKKDTVIADSGVALSKVARESLDAGLLGLEFGTGIPGTVGAAVVGNVGIPSGRVSDVLISAEVWHDGKMSTIPADSFDFDYRYSNLKSKEDFIVISAKFQLEAGDTEAAKQLAKEDIQRRAASYRGRTAGSYFKNPTEGKTAAELIDSLGLKGYRIGGAEVSTDHANVFRNSGDATAEDFYKLEKYVADKVLEKYDIKLEPEVSKLGAF